MNPMLFVALGVGLVACTAAADSAIEDSATSPPEASTTIGPRLHGRVIEGDGATSKTEDDASLDLAIFWDHYDTDEETRTRP